MEKLGLPLIPLDRPYKWMSDFGEFEVAKQVVVNFAIGKYVDQIVCDVVHMYHTHILLGKPWYKFNKVVYDMDRNIYKN